MHVRPTTIRSLAEARPCRARPSQLALLFAKALLVLTLCLPANAPAQQEMYTWTDENGVVHFDTSPPTHSTGPVETYVLPPPRPKPTPPKSVTKDAAEPDGQAAQQAEPVEDPEITLKRQELLKEREDTARLLKRRYHIDKRDKSAIRRLQNRLQDIDSQLDALETQ